jgi:hypothetical protein
MHVRGKTRAPTRHPGKGHPYPECRPAGRKTRFAMIAMAGRHADVASKARRIKNSFR